MKTKTIKPQPVLTPAAVRTKELRRILPLSKQLEKGIFKQMAEIEKIMFAVESGTITEVQLLARLEAISAGVDNLLDPVYALIPDVDRDAM